MLSRLTSRIIALSIFWVILALLATALLITWLYRDHIEQHYDGHVFTHVEELIAAVSVERDGQVNLRTQPTDPRFYRPDSGWYWQVTVGDRLLSRSTSLGDKSLAISGLNFDENHDVQALIDANGKRVRAQVVHMSHEHLPEPITILATAPDVQIMDDVADFGNHIALSFAVLGLGLSIAVVVQVMVALRPLKAIRNSISAVKAGQVDRLPTEFPDDVQPLVDELNSLIDHNESLLKRARSQLADLAHLLNTPLTLIRNEARRIPTERGQLILDQAHAMSGNIDHYLCRARASGQRNAFGYHTKIKSVINDLKFAVERMYVGREIDIKLCSKGDCTFRGEVQDLEEMLGNLLDNACKWADQKIEIRCRFEGNTLVISVEDDGPGIASDQLNSVLKRGHKLDETAPGYGQGLGIVKDIADMYGGHLVLGKSALGGLLAELHLPAVR